METKCQKWKQNAVIGNKLGDRLTVGPQILALRMVGSNPPPPASFFGM